MRSIPSASSVDSASRSDARLISSSSESCRWAGSRLPTGYTPASIRSRIVEMAASVTVCGTFFMM